MFNRISIFLAKQKKNQIYICNRQFLNLFLFFFFSLLATESLKKKSFLFLDF
jgi:hypothetical protein